MPNVASPTSRLPPVWATSPMLFFAVSRSSSLYTLSVSHCVAGLLSVRSAVCCHLLREFVCLWRMGIARIELLYFLTLYLVSIPLQLVTTSSFLHQGSTALIAVTAVHAGIVAALFWCLLGECIVLFTSFRPFVMFPPLSQPLRASCFIIFFFHSSLPFSVMAVNTGASQSWHIPRLLSLLLWDHTPTRFLLSSSAVDK